MPVEDAWTSVGPHLDVESLTIGQKKIESICKDIESDLVAVVAKVKAEMLARLEEGFDQIPKAVKDHKEVEDKMKQIEHVHELFMKTSEVTELHESVMTVDKDVSYFYLFQSLMKLLIFHAVGIY